MWYHNRGMISGISHHYPITFATFWKQSAISIIVKILGIRRSEVVKGDLWDRVVISFLLKRPFVKWSTRNKAWGCYQWSRRKTRIWWGELLWRKISIFTMMTFLYAYICWSLSSVSGLLQIRFFHLTAAVGGLRR